MTTISEGDTLYLDCDAIEPTTNVKWLSPEEVVVSNETIFMIMNIQRSAAGIYTCVAKVYGTTRNSTVNVIVQSECHYSVNLYMHVQKVMCEEEELGKFVYIHS